MKVESISLSGHNFFPEKNPTMGNLALRYSESFFPLNRKPEVGQVWAS